MNLLYGIPSYMFLGGDEDGGVTLICDHYTCATVTSYGVAYHAGHGEAAARGLPYFGSRDLDGLFKFAKEHAEQHARTDRGAS